MRDKTSRFVLMARWRCQTWVDWQLHCVYSRHVLWGVYTIQQTSSKLSSNVFKINVLMLDVCWIV